MASEASSCQPQTSFSNADLTRNKSPLCRCLTMVASCVHLPRSLVAFQNRKVSNHPPRLDDSPSPRPPTPLDPSSLGHPRPNSLSRQNRPGGRPKGGGQGGGGRRGVGGAARPRLAEEGGRTKGSTKLGLLLISCRALQTGTTSTPVRHPPLSV